MSAYWRYAPIVDAAGPCPVSESPAKFDGLQVAFRSFARILPAKPVLEAVWKPNPGGGV